MDPHVKSGRIPSSTSNSVAALILITLRVLVFLVLFRHSLRPSLPSSSIVPGRNLDGSSVTFILQQTDVVLLPLLAAVKEATGVANPLGDSVFRFLLRYMKKKFCTLGFSSRHLSILRDSDDDASEALSLGSSAASVYTARHQTRTNRSTRITCHIM